MPWIRPSDRGFPAGKDGEALIQVIAIKEIERESERLLDNGARRARGYRSDADL